MLEKLEFFSLRRIKANYSQLIGEKKKKRYFHDIGSPLRWCVNEVWNETSFFFFLSCTSYTSELTVFVCMFSYVNQEAQVQIYSTQIRIWNDWLELVTDYWLNLYDFLNSIYCLKLRCISGFWHVCSRWKKLCNEYMAIHITCHLLSQFEVCAFRYCLTELFWSNQLNENTFKVWFVFVFVSWGR